LLRRGAVRGRAGNGRAAAGRALARTYLDPNRHAGDVDLDLLDGRWPGEYRPSGKAKVGKALVWRTLEDGRPIYARKLPIETVRKRIEQFHAPYHLAIQDLIQKTFMKFGKVLSYQLPFHAPVAGKQSDDGEGNARADFVLGDRDGTSCDPAFTEFVRGALAGMAIGSRSTIPTRAWSWCGVLRSEGGPPQPADRNQQAALHGRDDLAEEQGI